MCLRPSAMEPNMAGCLGPTGLLLTALGVEGMKPLGAPCSLLLTILSTGPGLVLSPCLCGILCLLQDMGSGSTYPALARKILPPSLLHGASKHR